MVPVVPRSARRAWARRRAPREPALHQRRQGALEARRALRPKSAPRTLPPLRPRPLCCAAARAAVLSVRRRSCLRAQDKVLAIDWESAKVRRCPGRRAPRPGRAARPGSSNARGRPPLPYRCPYPCPYCTLTLSLPPDDARGDGRGSGAAHDGAPAPPRPKNNCLGPAECRILCECRPYCKVTPLPGPPQRPRRHVPYIHRACVVEAYLHALLAAGVRLPDDLPCAAGSAAGAPGGVEDSLMAWCDDFLLDVEVSCPRRAPACRAGQQRCVGPRLSVPTDTAAAQSFVRSYRRRAAGGRRGARALARADPRALRSPARRGARQAVGKVRGPARRRVARQRGGAGTRPATRSLMMAPTTPGVVLGWSQSRSDHPHHSSGGARVTCPISTG